LTPVAPRETPSSIAIAKMYASTSSSVSVSVSAIRRSAFRGRQLPRTGTDVVVKVVDDPRQQRTCGGRRRRRRCATTTTRAMEAAPRRELEKISSSEEFEAAIAESEDRVVVVDFMATWCRKCVFLKGKLEKYASRHDPNAVKFCVVDVNAVPQAMIRQCGVTKMPTLQIYRGSEKVWELIAGEDGESVLHKLTFAIEEQQKRKAKTSKSAR
jgi:thiol-disulfide isomerase/thioredoxin